MKRQVVVFRTLGNINRLKIIGMLFGGAKLNVGDIAQKLHISFKATSNHLAMLKNLDIIEAQSTAKHVFYFLSKEMPADFKKILNCINLK